jgi:hypothetical protein
MACLITAVSLTTLFVLGTTDSAVGQLDTQCTIIPGRHYFIQHTLRRHLTLEYNVPAIGTDGGRTARPAFFV